MNATHERRTALLRAYGLLLDLVPDGGEDAEADAPALTPAAEHELRVERYAARIEAGLSLHPCQRLTKRDRAELAKTDPDAPAKALRNRRQGRKSLASKTHLPFGERLNRDCRELAERLAKRFTGGVVPVPEVVRRAFAGESNLAKKWTEHVRSLACERDGRWRGATNSAKLSLSK